MMTVSNTIPACTTAINRYVDFSGRNVKLTNPRIVNDIYTAHMPKRIYVDNEGIILPDEIYTACNTSIEGIDINPKNKYYTSIDGIVYTAGDYDWPDCFSFLQDKRSCNPGLRNRNRCSSIC